MPASVTWIDTCIFDGCKSLTVHAPAGSRAESYAKEHRISFRAV